MFENDTEAEKIEIDWPPAASARVNRRRAHVRPHRAPRSLLHTVRLVVGRVFLSVGLLLFGFVAYQLWGTRFQEAHAQDRLAGQFEQALADRAAASGTSGAPKPGSTTTTATAGSALTTASSAGGSSSTADGSTSAATTSTTTSKTTSTATSTASTTPAIPEPPPAPGDPVAHLVIPKIGLDKIIVSGVAVDDLRKGPGHFPDTPLPGERGNTSIAGHRTTFGAPFNRVNELASGDRIEATTVKGSFVYLVSDIRIVRPDQYDVVGPTDDNVLTLVSCDPKLSATNRIIVRAVLDAEASSPVSDPGQAASPSPLAGVLPGDEPTPTSAGSVTTATGGGSTVATTISRSGGVDIGSERSTGAGASSAASQAFQDGWFSDQLAWADVAIWGGLLTGLALAAWQVSRRSRNLVGGLLGLAPFVVFLYFLYENVSRLLPPNL